jgi:hypothetical protein
MRACGATGTARVCGHPRQGRAALQLPHLTPRGMACCAPCAAACMRCCRECCRVHCLQAQAAPTLNFGCGIGDAIAFPPTRGVAANRGVLRPSGYACAAVSRMWRKMVDNRHTMAAH